MPAGDFDYEVHGGGYAARRRADPRIAALVQSALGDAPTVINVGAGAGSYEPRDRYVVAVEPSAAMRAQRPNNSPPALDAAAERLPFDACSFEASMACMTIHQWADVHAGLRELRRVARGPVVILTFDAQATDGFWLFDYFPELLAVERRRFPSIEAVCATLGGEVDVRAVPVPIDCVDGFAEAYYARPEAFLRADVRAAQSSWRFIDYVLVQPGVRRLRRDLDSGAWDARHGHLRIQPERAGALRLIVARNVGCN